MAGGKQVLARADANALQDLVTANDPVPLRRGIAAGTFTGSPGGSEILQPDNLGVSRIGFADFSGDTNEQDLICPGESLAVSLDGSGLATVELYSDFGGGSVMDPGDYDADGNADLFVTGYGGFVRVFSGRGNGTFDASIDLCNGQL